MFSAFKAGGILMLPIIICGIVATYIIIERCYYFYITKKRDAKLKYELESSIPAGNFDAAEQSCNEADTPVSQVVKKALEARRWPEADMKEAVEAEMSVAIPRYEHLLTALGTISNIATLLGLLGTVTGNIKAFGVLGSGGTMGDPAVLAGAIGEALVTTVAGLVVSIPSVVFYNYFNSRVNRRVVEMENYVTNIVIKLTGRVQ